MTSAARVVRSAAEVRQDVVERTEGGAEEVAIRSAIKLSTQAKDVLGAARRRQDDGAGRPRRGGMPVELSSIVDGFELNGKCLFGRIVVHTE